ncbi:MAG: hypothetical protein K8J09_17230 [Planctomycetes bacterium]|nr:hypothetical protein [Planctomycetota bacterium]MCC7397573.1 hypothetical protein [Planctomycetota bacterium]
MVLLWMVATLRPDPVLGDVDMDIAGDASSGVAEIDGGIDGGTDGGSPGGD